MRKPLFITLSAVLLGASLALTSPVSAIAAQEPTTQETAVAESGAGGAFAGYQHDPRINSSAMADIVVNPDAVYGFSPDPASTRLGEYASYDWTDAAVVEAARQQRIEYLASFENQYKLWEEMNAQGKSVEEIARAVSALRNENRLASYKNDPEGLEKVKKSNLDTYGNENGPTADSLFNKYGSWEKVLMKSFSSNSGMDACLGLYDQQYEHNLLSGTVSENPEILYTVKDGDYLVKIARKYYGKDSSWRKIYDANKSVVGGNYTIYAGQKLVIPE